MIVSEQLNYIKTRRFHAIFMSVIIEFSRCIGTYSSAKFEFIIDISFFGVSVDHLISVSPSSSTADMLSILSPTEREIRLIQNFRILSSEMQNCIESIVENLRKV
mgnify:CR=1 FL=1